MVFSDYGVRTETMKHQSRNTDTSWHNTVVKYLCRRHISHLLEFIWNSLSLFKEYMSGASTSFLDCPLSTVALVVLLLEYPRPRRRQGTTVERRLGRYQCSSSQYCCFSE